MVDRTKFRSHPRAREKIYKEQAKERQRKAGGDRKSQEAKSVTQNSEQPISDRNKRFADGAIARDAGTSRDTVKRVRVAKSGA
jgi:hypothetical protein